MLFACAGVEREERRRGAGRREQELAAGHAQETGVALAVLASPADRLPEDRRERRLGVVLGVRDRPELDRETGVLIRPVVRRLIRRLLRPVHAPSSPDDTGAEVARFPEAQREPVTEIAPGEPATTVPILAKLTARSSRAASSALPSVAAIRRPPEVCASARTRRSGSSRSSSSVVPR